MDEFVKIFTNGGAVATLGGVLWYLLTKILPGQERLADKVLAGMRALEAAADRNAMSNALRLQSTPHILPEIKERAAEIIEAAKSAETERGQR